MLRIRALRDRAATVDDRWNPGLVDHAARSSLRAIPGVRLGKRIMSTDGTHAG